MAVSDEMPPEPSHRLERSVMIAWAAQGAAGTAGAGGALSIALPVLDEINGMPGWVRPALIAFVVALGIVSVLIAPIGRYRVWRYSVRADEIDLRHGWLVIKRTIVPMARVQHVETGRSFAGDTLGINKLTIHTAAGSVAIPGLRPDRANRLRTDIARHAHVPEDV